MGSCSGGSPGWPGTCPGPLWGRDSLQTPGRLRDLVTLCHIMETSNLQPAKPIMACHPTHPITWQSVRPTSTTRPATLLSLPPPGHHQHNTARQLINTTVKDNTKYSVNWMLVHCRHMKRQ